MALFSITRTRKPRQFQYTPRYYNPRAERLKAIIARAEQEEAEKAKNQEGVPPAEAQDSEAQRGTHYEARIQLSFQEANFARSQRHERVRTRFFIGLVLLGICLAFYYFL